MTRPRRWRRRTFRGPGRSPPAADLLAGRRHRQAETRWHKVNPVRCEREDGASSVVWGMTAGDSLTWLAYKAASRDCRSSSADTRTPPQPRPFPGAASSRQGGQADSCLLPLPSAVVLGCGTRLCDPLSHSSRGADELLLLALISPVAPEPEPEPVPARRRPLKVAMKASSAISVPFRHSPHRLAVEVRQGIDDILGK